MASYTIGKRLRKNPLFREGQVRKYKRRCREEAERADRLRNVASNPGGDSNVESAPAFLSNDEGATNTSRQSMGYVDQSLVGSHGVDSVAYAFYRSWPSSVCLVSGEKHVKWTMNLDSQHCRFCKPAGKCSELKELLDHLDTHHPDFTYSSYRAGSDAIIIVRVHRLVSFWLTADMSCR